MGIGDFWLKPYNKKTLDEFNGDIKRQDLSSKFDALFNVWDKDKSGKLEANEVSSIFNQIAESERVDDQEFLGEIFTKVSKSNANDLAKRFFKIAEDNESNKSMKEFQKFLDEEVTADNILDLLDAYDNPDIKKQDSSLIDTVVSEKLMSGDKTSQKKVLLTILDKVCEAARKYGVAEDDINNARKDFEDSIKEEYGSLSSMFRMADSLKMERAIDFLRGAILIKQNQVENVDSKDAMLTVTEQFYSDNETAYDEFNIERSATAKFGDWVCGLFGCKTLDDMKSKLDMNVEGANELLTALVNEDEEGFKVAYKKLFGIEFDPQKIAAAQELSEKVSAIQMLTSNLQVFEEIKNSSNLEEILKEKFKYSDEVIEEIIKDYPAENKDESLKLFIEESFNNAKDMILELSDGKTLEQLGNDVELATKSAYGDNDISKEIAKFNQNMVLTEAFADSAFEILGTIALTMIPVVGQLGAAALAARTAKMGSNMVKVTNMLRKTSVAMYKANKFQQGTKYSSKVKNYGARAISASVNSATATAGVNTWSDKDIKEILKKTIMNSSFSWIGVTSNTIAPILMSKFNITSKLATELAEEILNVAGSYGVTKANGADYTQTDAFVDLATGLIFARIAGGNRKNVEVRNKTVDYPDFILPKLKESFKAENIDETVVDFIKHYSESAPQIKQYLEDFGLSGLGNTRSRVKGYQSLHDKITNFLKDKPNATYEDVWNEIRDCFGARTVIDPTDFKNHPDVKDLIKKGDMDGAIRRAAELQSEPLVQEFKNIIDKNCSGDKRITTARISNYVSEDGIPYLSEAQLAEIKQYAASKGVKINIVEKLAKDDPHYAEAMAAGYKPTTKSQPSGYTALQINFKTTDGDVFEWQYRGALVDNFAEGEHIPYDLRTGKDIIGEHEELRPLYEPLQKILSEDNMPKDIYKQYNKYLTDYYTHLRKLELGFESTPPKLSDYEINGFKFDSVLEAENLIKIHEIADDLKHNKISQQDAINKYKKLTQG